MKGCFITLEGGEGGGKSTQLQLLADALRRQTSREVIATRSPGGTLIAEKIRRILKTPEESETLVPDAELLLFAACHAQMCASLIRPALERGAIIISDRFIDSTSVYQGVARGISHDVVEYLNQFATAGLKPDLTIVLDLDIDAGRARANARNGMESDRFDSESAAFFQSVRSGFLKLAENDPARVAVVDASADPQTVLSLILEQIHERLAIF